MRDVLIQITGTGIHYLNVSQKRCVIFEKTRKLSRSDKKLFDVNEQMLEILDKISHGRKVFKTYFTDAPHWRHGKDAVNYMLNLGLISQELWSPPPVYKITYA